MKIYISVDLEGICGIVNWADTEKDGKDIQRARRLITAETNAAIEGAVKAGARDILVNDAHHTMTNIIAEELDPAACLLSGYPKLNSMMEGLDHTFDGVIFIGYHSMMNSRGVLNHTYSGRTVSRLRLNGRDAGELAMNTFIAGHFNVPVLMASGDNHLAAEASELVSGIVTVPVKEARGRYSALCVHPETARARIREGAYSAVKNAGNVQPVKIESPVVIEVTLLHSGMADEAEIMPGVKRTGANVLTYTASDILTAYRAFRTITALASSVCE